MAEQMESPGSSAQTAIAVGVGAVVGATALAVAAPIVLPVVGLGALVGLGAPIIGATVGGWLGWKAGGKK